MSSIALRVVSQSLTAGKLSASLSAGFLYSGSVMEMNV